MRIIIILALVYLTACSSLQTQYQKPHYNLFAKSVEIMADSMRQNIFQLQKLDQEAQLKTKALKFVRGEKLQNLPTKSFSDSMIGRLEFLQNLQNAVSALAFNVPLSQQKLALLAQTIRINHQQKQIAPIQQEAHAILQRAIKIMVADWQSEPMQSLPQDIIASINASELRLLLIARNHEKISVLELEHATRQHLQKQKQRKKFLTNWQNLKSLTKKMQIAHEALLQNQQKAPIQDFYKATLKLQNQP